MIILTQLKENPTPRWLDGKIDHYIKAGANDTAWKFLETYANITPGFDAASAILRIDKARKKQNKTIKKETKKDEVKGDDKK